MIGKPGGASTVQVNVASAESCGLPSSVAVTVTVNAPATLGAPTTMPVSDEIVTPVGKPDAVQVSVSPSGSVAVGVIRITVCCSSVRSSSASTLGDRLVSPMVHRNDTSDDAVGVPLSMTVTVTPYEEFSE